MSATEKEYTKGTCYHGYAGIASAFVALADRMVKKGGTLALVLPMTALQGMSWQKVRELISSAYRDVTILTICYRSSGAISRSRQTPVWRRR